MRLYDKFILWIRFGYGFHGLLRNVGEKITISKDLIQLGPTTSLREIYGKYILGVKCYTVMEINLRAITEYSTIVNASGIKAPTHNLLLIATQI